MNPLEPERRPSLLTRRLVRMEEPKHAKRNTVYTEWCVVPSNPKISYNRRHLCCVDCGHDTPLRLPPDELVLYSKQLGNTHEASQPVFAQCTQCSRMHKTWLRRDKANRAMYVIIGMDWQPADVYIATAIFVKDIAREFFIQSVRELRNVKNEIAKADNNDDE